MPRLIKITTLLIKRYFNGLNFNFVTKQTIETILKVCTSVTRYILHFKMSIISTDVNI